MILSQSHRTRFSLFVCVDLAHTAYACSAVELQRARHLDMRIGVGSTSPFQVCKLVDGVVPRSHLPV